ncbi:MAG: Transposase IS200 like protein [Candidatus Hydrogenedentes bacterium ADurb.Bin179]|jgi:type I restriction enzyme R subunit|nr:MAG: Transposase IS200 like protein [Candidatus Hydrogenedentes bacterium ADurb.Bin179]
MKEPDTFNYRFLEQDQRIEIYRSHLPHWRQEGAVYYVTFRLADSIPGSVLRQWTEADAVWRAAHGITPEMSETEQAARYARIPENLRQVFERDQHRRLHVELDRCHGACLLRKPAAAQQVAGALHFHHGTRLHCGDFVVMPNHVHWVVVPYPDNKLQIVCGSVKQYSATQINRLTGRTGRLWQHENFDHAVRNAGELQRIRDYIHNNPQKAHLSQGDYVYHKADWILDER